MLPARAASPPLTEQPGGIGAEAVLVLVSALRTGQRAHAGTHELAIRQHDLDAAAGAELVAIRTHGVADSMIE
jgi:hypothetical protein